MTTMLNRLDYMNKLLLPLIVDEQGSFVPWRPELALGLGHWPTFLSWSCVPFQVHPCTHKGLFP